MMNTPQGGSDPSPYNVTNVLMTADDVRQWLEKYGLSGEDLAGRLLEIHKAMVHRSYCIRKNETILSGNTLCPKGCLPLQEESNERLEFLGDSVINQLVAEYLFERFPTENEGFLTRMRSKLVNGQMLSELALVLGLDRFILLSKQVEDNEGRMNKKILEDAFEAFVGALYLTLDNYAKMRQWFVTFLEGTVDITELVLTQNNNKDLLLKYFNHLHGRQPVFVEEKEGKPGTQQRFNVSVRNPAGVVVGLGTGPSRKLAEDDAARAALAHYGVSAFEISSL